MLTYSDLILIIMLILNIMICMYDDKRDLDEAERAARVVGLSRRARPGRDAIPLPAQERTKRTSMPNIFIGGEAGQGRSQVGRISERVGLSEYHTERSYV